MDINRLIEKIKKDHDFKKIGMIASHLGVVRGSSRDGQPVNRIDVVYDHEKVNIIINDIKRLKGIVNVLVETCEGPLKVGEDIMAVVVAGDIRENVFPALVKTVNRIKEEAVKKKEFIQ